MHIGFVKQYVRILFLLLFFRWELSPLDGNSAYELALNVMSKYIYAIYVPEAPDR